LKYLKSGGGWFFPAGNLTLIGFVDPRYAAPTVPQAASSAAMRLQGLVFPRASPAIS
jgi:hypothetical protein